MVCYRYAQASHNADCLSRESGQPNYVLTLVAAQLLIGIGGSPLYTLGTAYIDNHVNKRKAPSYIGTLDTTTNTCCLCFFFNLLQISPVPLGSRFVFSQGNLDVFLSCCADDFVQDLKDVATIVVNKDLSLKPRPRT